MVENADRTMATLAARQHGVVSRAQLLARGIAGATIKRRVRAGLLQVLHRGVYLVGARRPARGTPELAAILSCGDGAVVSHRSAIWLWQLLPYPANPRPVEVTVVGRDVRRTGIRVHRVEALERRDTRAIEGIPATSPARALLDAAAVLPPNLLERATAEAQARRMIRRRDLVDQLRRNPRRAGTGSLRRLLEGGPALTRSEAERRMLKLIRASELPPPEVNVDVGGFEVDFLWRAQRLVVEVDGFQYHSSRAAFERDRRRDATLASSGYTVLRVTWRQLIASPEAVIARIAAALAARG